jgi:hypothetical protein
MLDKKPEIWDAQEWVRTAPLKTAANFVWWAQGVIDMREAAEAQPKRKTRSDAGKSRRSEELPFDRSQEDMREGSK